MPEPHPIYDGLWEGYGSDADIGGLWPLTGGRGYSDAAPRDPVTPFLRWALVSDIPHQRLESGDNIDAHIQFDVYADRTEGAAAQEIDARLRTVFDRKNIDVVGFSRAHMMCVQRGKPAKEERYYRIRSRYRLVGSAA